MGACDAQNFKYVTLSVWKCVVDTVARDYGIHLSGYSGKVSKDGFTFVYNYDPNSQEATVQCTDSPFYIPCSIINDTIQKEAHKCLPSSGAESGAQAGAASE